MIWPRFDLSDGPGHSLSLDPSEFEQMSYGVVRQRKTKPKPF